MWEHTRDFYEGKSGDMGGMGDYKVSVVKKFSKCLPRQVNEDVRMQEFESSGYLIELKARILHPNKCPYTVPAAVNKDFLSVAQLSQAKLCLS